VSYAACPPVEGSYHARFRTIKALCGPSPHPDDQVAKRAGSLAVTASACRFLHGAPRSRESGAGLDAIAGSEEHARSVAAGVTSRVFEDRAYRRSGARSLGYPNRASACPPSKNTDRRSGLNSSSGVCPYGINVWI